MLQEYLGQRVVVDMRSPFVCIGTLEGMDHEYLRLTDADLHDIRDSDTTRENYTAASRTTGIKRNRKVVLLMRSDVVAISRFKDIVDE